MKKHEFSDTIDKGLVTRIDPEAGSDAESGSTVTIYISKGKKKVMPITKVKVVNGKVEYRDIDGKIKYGKYKFIYGGYCYWYTMKDGRGFWMPIENTNLSDWSEDMLETYWFEQNFEFN